MKLSSTLIGRGLLLLSLSGYMVACGDDEDKGHHDAGGGSGGTSGAGGNDSDAGGKGGAGAGGGVSIAECIMSTTAALGDHADEKCATCACNGEKDLTDACDSVCWDLIYCVVEKCSGSMDMGCAATMCGEHLTGATAAVPLAQGMVLEMCASDCFTLPEPDGGADGG